MERKHFTWGLGIVTFQWDMRAHSAASRFLLLVLTKEDHLLKWDLTCRTGAATLVGVTTACDPVPMRQPESFERDRAWEEAEMLFEAMGLSTMAASQDHSASA
eukprot:578266-Amphidinium_carterae.1